MVRRWVCGTTITASVPGPRWARTDGRCALPIRHPEYQLTGAATWTGEWAGYQQGSPMIGTGEARVTVTLGNEPLASLALDDVFTLGDLQWGDMPITDGRFAGTITAPNSGEYDAIGQFGGADQGAVVGHVGGADLATVCTMAQKTGAISSLKEE